MIWAAPGSLFVPEVGAAWRRRVRVSDLGSVTGPWAVALCDPTTGDQLLAVDPIGVQPLYWVSTDSGAVVASSWLAQVADRPDVDDRLDYEGILLDQGWGCSGPGVAHRTMLAAVSRVPGGHVLRVRPDGTTRLERYWDPSALPGPDNSLSLLECAELLRERIDSAIRRVTPTDVPVGSHVSGGIDCTTVALRVHSILRDGGGGLTAGYSWAPSDAHVPRLPGDERDVLDGFAQAAGFPVRTIHRDSSGEWFLDLDPTRYPDSSHRHERWTLPQAQADGIAVLMSGWGGDEFASFNGGGAMRHLVRRGKLATAWRETSQRLDVALPEPVSFRRRARSFASSLSLGLPGTAGDWLRHPYEARTLHRRAAEIDAALRDYSPLAAEIRMEQQRAWSSLADHNELQRYLLTDGHLQHRTAGWYQTGRLFGIDYRYPLLDLGVVEAALRLPWWGYRSHGWSRVAYRMAVEPWVPNSLAWSTVQAEPALATYLAQRAATAPASRPRRVHDDPSYDEVMRLVAITWDTGHRRRDSTVPWRSRPDLAPRLG